MTQGIKAEIESIDAIKKKLAVTVPEEKVAQEFDRAYRKLQKNVTMPGFRRGRVPMHLVRKIYGQDVHSDVARELISIAYHEALKQTGANPVSEPDIKDFNLAEGEPLTFDAEFEVRPEIKLSSYKGLKIAGEMDEVTEDDITKVLEDLRLKVATVAGVADDRPLAEGNIAIIDFEGFCDGQPLQGGKAEDYPLEIGSKSFIPGFEEALIGLRTGEEKQFALAFPDDYQQPELAGKEGQFMVTMKAVKERVLPDIDDEFARDVGEYSNLEELKKKISENLSSVREKEANSVMKQKLVEQLVESTEFELPPSLLELEKANIERDYRRRLSLRGIHPDEIKKQMEAEKAEVEKAAAKNVKTSMILDEIARLEEIKVEKDDLAGALKELSDRYKKPVSELRKEMIKSGAMENLVQMLLEEKALDFLLENADSNIEKKSQEKGGQ